VYARDVIDKRELREMVEEFVAAFAAVMERHLHEVFADAAPKRAAPHPVEAPATALVVAEAAPAPTKPAKRSAPKRRGAKPAKRQRRKPEAAVVAAPAAEPQPAPEAAGKRAGTPRANVDALVEEAWARRQVAGPDSSGRAATPEASRRSIDQSAPNG